MRRLLVTGISGNLGRRLAPLLAGYDVISVDLHLPPQGTPAGRFVQLDLSRPDDQDHLADLVANEDLDAVVHLAFVIDPVRTGILDEKRMWTANVVATQHLLESIARANSTRPRVRLFVYPSSVSAYGPELPYEVREYAPLQAHTMPYAVQKRETDVICREMHPRLGGCAVYVFRPHIFAGRTVDNFILRAFRGKPSGRGWLARTYERWGWKVPMLVPSSARGANLFQFVHIDDVARVLHWTLENFHPGQLEVFNLAGWGPPVSFAECVGMAGTPIIRLPSLKLVQLLLRLFWAIGLSGYPPETLPYSLGSYTMDTSRLREALGPRYHEIVHWSSRDAVADALRP